MILENTIKKLLRDVANLILATPNFAVEAKQDDPRPTGEYATVDFLTSSRIGIEQSTYTNNIADPDLTQNIEGSREFVFTISFYRGEAKDNARKVKIGLTRESTLALFRAAKLGYVKSGQIIDFDEPLLEGWEERAHFDVTLSGVDTDSDLITAIESVDIAAEFQARNLQYNTTIGVS